MSGYPLRYSTVVATCLTRSHIVHTDAIMLSGNSYFRYCTADKRGDNQARVKVGSPSMRTCNRPILSPPTLFTIIDHHGLEGKAPVQLNHTLSMNAIPASALVVLDKMVTCQAPHRGDGHGVYGVVCSLSLP